MNHGCQFDGGPTATRFRVLLVGHDGKSSPEATLTFAAVAAINGLRADGAAMPNAAGEPASYAAIARELCQHVGVVRRAAAELLEADEVQRLPAGLVARPEALAKRWIDHRRRIRLDERVRTLGLRAAPLLLAGLVLGQVDQRGRLVLGRQWLAERLGWTIREGKNSGRPSRSLDVARAAAERAGAIHTWTIPGSWQFCLAPGPSRNRNRDGAQIRNRETGDDVGHRETATRGIAKPQRGASRNRNATLANPQQTSGLPSGTSGSPPEPLVRTEAPAAPAGESEREQAEGRGQCLDGPDVRELAGAWAVSMAAHGVERMLPAIHAVDVVRLFAALGTEPAQVHDAEALARDRREVAKRFIAWCPSPERLARCCVVAAVVYGAQNVVAYLRKAAAAGDPGTMLARHGQGEGVLGSAAENALRGERVGAVAELVASVAAVHDARLTAAQRDQLRAELATHMRHGHIESARRVLLLLVGPDHSDVAVARAIGQACTLDQARQVLGAA